MTMFVLKASLLCVGALSYRVPEDAIVEDGDLSTLEDPEESHHHGQALEAVTVVSDGVDRLGNQSSWLGSLVPSRESVNVTTFGESAVHNGATAGGNDADPVDLTLVQKADPSMFQHPEVTLQQIRNNLKRGTGLPLNPMPKDELEANTAAHIIASVSQHRTGVIFDPSHGGALSETAVHTDIDRTGLEKRAFADAINIRQSLETTALQDSVANVASKGASDAGAHASALDSTVQPKEDDTDQRAASDNKPLAPASARCCYCWDNADRKAYYSKSGKCKVCTMDRCDEWTGNCGLHSADKVPYGKRGSVNPCA